MYRVERSQSHIAAKVEDTMRKMKSKIADFEERLKIKKTDTPLEINEEWHAELSKDALSSVEKLQTFVQDEVYLQFSHHFRKLGKLRDNKHIHEKQFTM